MDQIVTTIVSKLEQGVVPWHQPLLTTLNEAADTLIMDIVGAKFARL